VDTPRRFLRAIHDATDGYDGDPKLLTAFPTECRGGPNCELAQVVEDEYGVVLKGEDMKDLKTVGDAIDLIVQRAG